MSNTKESETGQNPILRSVSVSEVGCSGLIPKLVFTMSLAEVEPFVREKPMLPSVWKITSVSQGSGLLQIGDTVSINYS